MKYTAILFVFVLGVWKAAAEEWHLCGQERCVTFSRECGDECQEDSLIKTHETGQNNWSYEDLLSSGDYLEDLIRTLESQAVFLHKIEEPLPSTVSNITFKIEVAVNPQDKAEYTIKRKLIVEHSKENSRKERDLEEFNQPQSTASVLAGIIDSLTLHLHDISDDKLDVRTTPKAAIAKSVAGQKILALSSDEKFSDGVEEDSETTFGTRSASPLLLKDTFNSNSGDVDNTESMDDVDLEKTSNRRSRRSVPSFERKLEQNRFRRSVPDGIVKATPSTKRPEVYNQGSGYYRHLKKIQGRKEVPEHLLRLGYRADGIEEQTIERFGFIFRKNCKPLHSKRGEHDNYPHPKDCGAFYKVQNDVYEEGYKYKMHRQICPPGQQFAVNLQLCLPPSHRELETACDPDFDCTED